MSKINQVGGHTFYIDSFANVGVFEYGGKCCFIDSGGDRASAEKALSLVEERGLKLEKVFLTHSHADHIGGAAFLQRKTGCTVYAPGVCAALVEYPALTPVTLFGGYPTEEMRPRVIMSEPCECEKLTESALPSGLRYIHIDGHDFEQAAFGTSDGVWFCADCVVGEHILEKYKIAFIHDAEEHLKSLEKLKKLDGKLFIPAHDKPRTDIKPLVDGNIGNIMFVLEEIKRFCADGITIDGLLEKIFSAFHIKLYLTQYELIGHTTRSLLAYLKKKGEIACVYKGSRLLWKTRVL